MSYDFTFISRRILYQGNAIPLLPKVGLVHQDGDVQDGGDHGEDSVRSRGKGWNNLVGRNNRLCPCILKQKGT